VVQRVRAPRETGGRRALVTFADRLVLYVLVGVALVLLLTGSVRTPGSSVRIEGADGFELVLPLDRPAVETVPGPLGPTLVEISDGTVRVLESSCPRGHCVRMGSIRTPGQTVVCVPNRVVVTIEGDAPPSVDATTR